MKILIIQLDTFRKHRNPQEYRPINRARCEGLEHYGDGDNIAGIAKSLIAADYPPNQTACVLRGSTECFGAQTISEWASGGSKGERPAHLRKETQA